MRGCKSCSQTPQYRTFLVENHHEMLEELEVFDGLPFSERSGGGRLLEGPQCHVPVAGVEGRLADLPEIRPLLGLERDLELARNAHEHWAILRIVRKHALYEPGEPLRNARACCLELERCTAFHWRHRRLERKPAGQELEHHHPSE